MAKNLLKNGIPLLVWNRSTDKSETLQKEFPSLVTVAPTPADVSAKCNSVISMLSTPEAMREVYSRPSADGGLLAGIHGSSQIIECGTYEPVDVEWAAAQVHSRSGAFLAAPVSGSKVPAETGQLVFIASGDQAVAQDGASYLQMMGKSTHYLGSKPGDAAKMKLIVNSIMGNMLACLSEGIHLSDKVDISSATLLKVLSEGAIATPMFAAKGPNMIKDRSETSVEIQYSPHFPLKHAYKDIRFAIGWSR